jgi:hypothetical protein
MFSIDYVTLLHNYLATWGSYVDHSRRFIRKITDSTFQASIAKQKQIMNLEEETNFVKNLRNFDLHSELPLVGFDLHYLFTSYEQLKKGEIVGVTKAMPSLRIDDLLHDNDWTGQSRTMLEEIRKRSPYIEIMPLILKNHKVTNEFHNWLISSIKSLKPTEK